MRDSNTFGGIQVVSFINSFSFARAFLSAFPTAFKSFLVYFQFVTKWKGLVVQY
jgi:hypothetical protein